MRQENLGTAVTESQNARFPPRFKAHLKGVMTLTGLSAGLLDWPCAKRGAFKDQEGAGMA